MYVKLYFVKLHKGVAFKVVLYVFKVVLVKLLRTFKKLTNWKWHYGLLDTTPSFRMCQVI